MINDIIEFLSDVEISPQLSGAIRQYHERLLDKRLALSKLEYLAKISPSYDEKLATNHPGKIVKLPRGDVTIDAYIAELVELMHRDIKFPLTTSSCEHDFYGWVNLSFNGIGYARWIRKIEKRTFKRYNICTSEDQENFFGSPDYDNCFLYKYIYRAKLTASSCVFSGYGPFINFEVNWQFDRRDVPDMVRTLKCLYEVPTN